MRGTHLTPEMKDACKQTIIAHLMQSRSPVAIAQMPTSTRMPDGSELSITNSALRQLLADLVAESRIDFISEKQYGPNARRLYYITPYGREKFLSEPVHNPDRSQTLMGDDNLMTKLPPEYRAAKSTATSKSSEDEFRPAINVAETLQVLAQVDEILPEDPDLAFEVGALAAKLRQTIVSNVAPCPYCGSVALEFRSVERSYALCCNSCGIAMSYRHDPKDVNALVRAWNSRVAL